MYVVELFASVHVCVLMNLIYRSKIYAPKSCSARASTTPVPVCKCNVPLPLYLILYELHTIFLGIIWFVDLSSFTWYFNYSTSMYISFFVAKFLMFHYLQEMIYHLICFHPNFIYLFNFYKHSTHGSTLCFSHCNLNTSMERYFFSSDVTCRRWFTTANCLQAGHCRGHQQAPVVPHRCHRR